MSHFLLVSPCRRQVSAMLRIFVSGFKFVNTGRRAREVRNCKRRFQEREGQDALDSEAVAGSTLSMFFQ